MVVVKCLLESQNDRTPQKISRVYEIARINPKCPEKMVLKIGMNNKRISVTKNQTCLLSVEVFITLLRAVIDISSF